MVWPAISSVSVNALYRSRSSSFGYYQLQAAAGLPFSRAAFMFDRLDRMGEPSDIAKAVVFLASDYAGG